VISQMNGHVVASMLRTIPKTSDIPVVLYEGGTFAKSLDKDTMERMGVTAVVETNRASELIAAAGRALKS
jgi:hypothetical protein